MSAKLRAGSPAQKAIALARRVKRDLTAVLGFQGQRRQERSDGPIRVGFLCEYIPAWSKVKPIYDHMAADERFEPVILCVPSNVRERRAEDRHNDVYDYFVANGFACAVNTLCDDGSWLDLKSLGLSYLFYLRPYNYLLPPAYENHRVYKYCKVCMVIYGMSMTREVAEAVMDRDFFRHVYCYFAETPFAMEKNRRDSWLLHSLGLQKSVFLGMPGMEEIAASAGKQSPAWSFSKGDFRLMWTPRWTTDPMLGGTNFFEYYEKLLDFAREEPGIDFLFRPHPMALRNFVQTGEMTAEESARFRVECGRIDNVSLDQEKEYTATMWQSDVLVTDISGMMAEFFVTGKPVIYCASNMVLTPAEHTRRMLQGCYVVRTWQELKDAVLRLRRGEDPLAQRRQELIKELFGGIGSCPSRAVVEELAKDFER